MPSVFKLYGHFLKNILNETEMGERYLEQFNKIVQRQYLARPGRGAIGKSADEAEAIFQVGQYKSSFGCVKKINKAFTSFFGYHDEEIVNQPIHILLPRLL